MRNQEGFSDVRLSWLARMSIIIFITCMAIGCGGSSGDGDTPVAEEETTQTPPSQDIAIILSHEIANNSTTSDEKIQVYGTVDTMTEEDLPDVLSWKLESGGTTIDSGAFTVDTTGGWSGTVDLETGDNTITLSVPDTGASLSIQVTCNPGYDFGSELELTPDVAYIGEDRLITATITLNDEITDPEDVILVRVDGTETQVVRLMDDGACVSGTCPDSSSGDEIGGDYIYTGRFTLNEASSATALYRVAVGLTDNTGTVYSEKYRIMITEHLSDELLEDILTDQKTYQDRIDHAVATGTVKETLEAIVNELQNDPDVSYAAVNSGGRGIGILYTSGIAGVLSANLPDTKAGSAEQESVLPVSETSTIPSEIVETEQIPPTRQSVSYMPYKADAATGGNNPVGSRNVMVIACQYQDWGYDDVVQMKNLFDETCFDVTHYYVEKDGGGSVEYFKNLGQYGVILISTHGDTFYEGIKSLWFDIWGSNSSSAFVVLDSNTHVTKDNKKTYEDDLKQQRLLIYGGFNYGITPAFIAYYSKSFHNSLVYIGACRSIWNTSMASVFRSKGAGAYLGFTNYVGTNFCIKVAPPVIEKLMEDPGNTLNEAFTPGLVENDKDKAEFKMFGDKTLSLGVTGIVDGSFEYAIKSPAWKKEGDFRIEHCFGGSKPTDPPPPPGQLQSGNVHLGLISTGLGKTQSSGSASQKICIPEKAVALSFDWNFYSEEFKEYCDTVYDDTFRVFFRDVETSAEYTLFEISVNDLCQNTDALLQQPSYLNMGEGDAWYTGWHLNQQVDIQPYKSGEPLILVFSVSDKGDSIYDTAVLLDNIRLIEEE